MKNKNTAGVFALLFGPLGIHRFYLGEKGLGKLYLIGTFFLFFSSIKISAPLVLIMGVLSFIDAVLLFSMDREDFNEKYNQRFLNRSIPNAEAAPSTRPASQNHAGKLPRAAAPSATENNPWKAAGIEKFKDYDYDGAMGDFKKSLTVKFDDPAVHFNLACCYSLNERTDPAFFHLTKAVHFGFVDFDKIEKHEGLAHLRTQPEFKDFVKKGYQLHSAQPGEPAKDLLTPVGFTPLELSQTPKPTLLDQIKRLSDLRQQGILTEEEFMGMKEEVLRG